MSFEVVPGKQCGPFTLGMSLFAAMRVVKTLQVADTCKTSITYSRLHPVDSPVLVDVAKLGMRLRFESAMQQLFLIEVYDLDLVSVSFNNQTHVVGKGIGKETGTLRAMYPVLGATHAGFRRPELGRDAFCFQYPGFLIQFAVPEKEVFQGIPFVLASTSQSPRVSRFFVHEVDFPKVIATSPIAKRLVEVAFKDDGPVVTFPRGFVIKIGETHCQEVLSSLSQPNSTCAKPKEQFANNKHKLINNYDYFFNYHTFGLDVLFDGKTHVVKQVILRTNLVPHPQFNVYAKCCFHIKFQLKPRKRAAAAAPPPVSPKAPAPRHHHLLPTSFEELLMGSSSEPSPPPLKPKVGTATVSDLERTVTCDEKWTSIANKLDMQNEQPMVHEPPEQPFGPCWLFSTTRSVFEIDQQSLHIATFTIF
ncbi:hypothetical protein BASA81_002619 [Batrachochytrium salamandrivorans]|nr:hypothetical protein BASA81_002619 [Batrachochytrium salamandrivorans]